MNKLLIKIVIQERLVDGSIKTTQSLVFTETLDFDYARKLAIYHIVQAHSKDPMITSIESIKFDVDDENQCTLSESFIVRVASIIEVSAEQIQFLGSIDILGYDLGRTRIKNYFKEN